MCRSDSVDEEVDGVTGLGICWVFDGDEAGGVACKTIPGTAGQLRDWSYFRAVSRDVQKITEKIEYSRPTRADSTRHLWQLRAPTIDCTIYKYIRLLILIFMRSVSFIGGFRVSVKFNFYGSHCSNKSIILSDYYINNQYMSSSFRNCGSPLKKQDSKQWKIHCFEASVLRALKVSKIYVAVSLVFCLGCWYLNKDSISVQLS